MEKPIVLLCSDGDSTRAIYDALRTKFGSVLVIMEQPMSRMAMARRRAKRIGWMRVAGQILFITTVVAILAVASRKRIREIEAEYNLANEWHDAEINYIETVNSDEARDRLRQIQPEIVVVNGTRIIGNETLRCVDATFINTHAGITPLYRGVHGAYWALAEGRPDLVGTTVHFVDEGIDTGDILRQAYFSVTDKDNYVTYPYLHTAAGIPILLDAVENCLEGKIQATTKRDDLQSKLRYHPTIYEYLFYRVAKGVR